MKRRFSVNPISTKRNTDPTRRMFLQMGSLMVTSWVIVACSRRSSTTASTQPEPLDSTHLNSANSDASAFQSPTLAQELSPTPACPDEPTASQTEGPFYTPDSPERTSLIEPGITGTKIILAGTVLSRSCMPIAQAIVDFWHADDGGEYDNAGYKLRGHQFTDEAGRYVLETIVPGLYPGRTRHIHVKVQAPNQPILTTQLYFPNEPQNERDRLFNPQLLMTMQNTEVSQTATVQTATFDFVLDT